MPRGLDHIVHAVHDLDAAAAVYERLGFTVGARNRHPWGTHNRIVQLPGFFIEILAVGERREGRRARPPHILVRRVPPRFPRPSRGAST